MQIERNDGELSRVVYGFWINNRKDSIELVFDSYTVEKRASKRHKWVVEEAWSRLNIRSNNGRKALSDRPELPADVAEEAKAELMKRTVVVEDWGRTSW
jgi:hypothetical protein